MIYNNKKMQCDEMKLSDNLTIKHVKENDENFVALTNKLQDFQYTLMPELKTQGYNLTDDLVEIDGFVLCENEKPIASIGLKQVSKTRAEIVRVFVDENYRGKGYAKLLFDIIENHARLSGYREVEMIAWTKSVAALGLYKKLGYEFSHEKTSEWFFGLKYVELYKKL